MDNDYLGNMFYCSKLTWKGWGEGGRKGGKLLLVRTHLPRIVVQPFYATFPAQYQGLSLGCDSGHYFVFEVDLIIFRIFYQRH